MNYEQAAKEGTLADTSSTNIFISRYSGTNYDRWSYEQAAKGGTLADTPMNKLQHKFWVAKQVSFFLKYVLIEIARPNLIFVHQKS